MNAKKLSNTIRVMSAALYESAVESTGGITADMADVCELLKVLSRVVDGNSIKESFGAPGRWGYGTLIGEALAARTPAEEVPNEN